MAPHCRLFVIPASAAPRAVIVRRGPSAWAHVIGWDLERDRFEHGAWLRGRLFAERCDVSPDGTLFLYFAMQGRKAQTTYTHAWSAVSRVPWLAALALWPQGTTYGGGGRFTGPRRLALRNGAPRAHPDHPATGLVVESGCPPVHASSGEVDGAEWSGSTADGRLVYTSRGKLFRRTLRGDVELADFDGLEPTPASAPDWATAPLKPVRPSGARRR